MPATKDDLLAAARRYEGLHHRMADAVASGETVARDLAREMSVAAVMLVMTALDCDVPRDWCPQPALAPRQ